MELETAYQQLQALERLFVDAYVSELQTDASKAGQKVIDFVKANRLKDYDWQTKHAAFNARKMMEKPLVRSAIRERIDAITAAFSLDAERTLREVGALAFSNMRDYFRLVEVVPPHGPNPGQYRLDLDMMAATREQWSAIKKIKIEENVFTGTRKTEVELHAKQPALDAMLALHGLKAPDANSPAMKNITPPPSPEVERMMITAQTKVQDAADLYARTLRSRNAA